MSAPRSETAAGAGPQDGDRAWYLVQLKPNGVARARRGLERQGIEVFAPLQRLTRRHGSRFREALALLFPGYVFVSVPSESGPWRTINATPGVARLVGFGNAPRAVPQALVAGIMARCDAAGVLGTAEDIRQGQRVQVVSGPFAGFVSRIERIDPDRRVWLVLDLMGTPTNVALDMAALRQA